ncbi:MAG: PQQ-binding-like beta-propeller repeat protein [Pirellulaceae bacterium]|nr:PQQ-binding-like beta-propeller repeat protein [Pirellulaceae bacterium]
MTIPRLALLILLLACATAQAEDWPRFRGPNGTGISGDDTPTPTSWSPTENLKWKTPLPGPGVSSPIVVGQRVFVTCYSGYGTDRRNPGNIEDLKRHLVCLDAESGKQLWEQTIAAAQPEDPYTGAGVPAHGYASHTPVSDGERVYVFFGKSGVLAFDLEGKQLWQKSVGTESDPRRWGSSSSPILYKDFVIVTASAESQALVALHKETGEEAWRQEATGLDNVWGTPALVEVDADRTDLVLGVPGEIWGFNPENGKLRWYCEAMQSDMFQSSVVIDGGVAYAIEGRNGGSIAVRVGGQNDVTDSHRVWMGRDAARYCSPVIHEGRLYYFANGIANCLDAKTGEQVFQSRLSGAGGAGGAGPPAGGPGGGFQGGRGGFGGGDYSSPVLAGGKLYYINNSGATFVIKAGDTFEQLAVNRLTEDRETFGGTPAVSHGKLFIRSDKHLYCVGGE